MCDEFDGIYRLFPAILLLYVELYHNLISIFKYSQCWRQVYGSLLPHCNVCNHFLKGLLEGRAIICTKDEAQIPKVGSGGLRGPL